MGLQKTNRTERENSPRIASIVPRGQAKKTRQQLELDVVNKQIANKKGKHMAAPGELSLSRKRYAPSKLQFRSVVSAAERLILPWNHLTKKKNLGFCL